MGFYLVSNRQDACSTKSYFFLMGFYPVSNRQDACSTKSYFFGMGFYSVINRQDACSTKNEFSCGVGILPARVRLIDIVQDVKYYKHNFFEKRRQVRYDVKLRSVLAGSSR